MKDTLASLLKDQDNRVAQLARMIKDVLNQLENDEITGSEARELLEDIERTRKLIEASIPLKKKLIINNAIKNSWVAIIKALT